MIKKGKSYLVRTILGEEACRAISNMSASQMKRLTPENIRDKVPDFYAIQRRFATEAEATAYEQGLADAGGWLETMPGDDGYVQLTDKLWKTFEDREY